MEVVIKLEREDVNTLLMFAQMSLRVLEDEDQAEILRIVAEIQKQTATAGESADTPGAKARTEARTAGSLG